jgi:hypothetical protein
LRVEGAGGAHSDDWTESLTLCLLLVCTPYSYITSTPPFQESFCPNSLPVSSSSVSLGQRERRLTSMQSWATIMEKVGDNRHRQSTTNTRCPTTRNQQQSPTATPDKQHSGLDNRQPTTKNKEVPPTVTPDIQNQHPTTNSQQMAGKKIYSKTRLKTTTCSHALSTNKSLSDSNGKSIRSCYNCRLRQADKIQNANYYTSR